MSTTGFVTDGSFGAAVRAAARQESGMLRHTPSGRNHHTLYPLGYRPPVLMTPPASVSATRRPVCTRYAPPNCPLTSCRREPDDPRVALRVLGPVAFDGARAQPARADGPRRARRSRHRTGRRLVDTRRCALGRRAARHLAGAGRRPSGSSAAAIGAERHSRPRPPATPWQWMPSPLTHRVSSTLSTLPADTPRQMIPSAPPQRTAARSRCLAGSGFRRARRVGTRGRRELAPRDHATDERGGAAGRSARLGGDRAAIAEAERLVRESPYREERWCLLALANYQSGRQAEALGGTSFRTPQAGR